MQSWSAPVQTRLCADLRAFFLDDEVVGEAPVVLCDQVDLTGVDDDSLRLDPVLPEPYLDGVVEGVLVRTLAATAAQGGHGGEDDQDGSGPVSHDFRSIPCRMTRRILPALILCVFTVAFASGCGEQDTDAKAPGQEDRLASVAPQYREGAKIFVERCSGCHSLGLVGAEGGALKPTNTEIVDGPNFNVRKESVDNVLYALHHGGFSGKIMPKGLVTGEEAQKVAEFLAYYAGYGGIHDRTPDGNSRRYKGDQ